MKLKLSMVAARWAAIALFVLAFSAQPVGADDFVISPAAFASLPSGTQEMLKLPAQQNANFMLNHLLWKLDEIDRVCALSDNQESKLKVAAKGAVEYALQNWIDAAGVQLAGAGIPGANPDAAAAVRLPLNAAEGRRMQLEQQQRQIALQQAQAAGGGRRGVAPAAVAAPQAAVRGRVAQDAAA
ncbi:MAG: hypothetical protein WD669_00235, partial [Pirellulales bacterium]